MGYISYRIDDEETGYYPNSDFTEDNLLAGWRRHNGEACPVHPDALVAIPAGTYHCNTQDGCFHYRAGELTWEDKRHFHVRNHIQSYRLLDLVKEPLITVDWDLKPDRFRHLQNRLVGLLKRWDYMPRL